MPRKAPIETRSKEDEVLIPTRHGTETAPSHPTRRRYLALGHAMLFGKVAALIGVSFLLSLPAAARLIHTGLFAIAIAFIGGPFLSS